MAYLVLVAWAFVVAAIPGVARALLARLVGMRVPALVIGVGPLVAAAQLGRTRLELRLLPFGAYSRVAGLSPVAEPVAHDAADAYPNRPIFARALVSFAGVIGYAAACVVFGSVLALGYGVPDGTLVSVAGVFDGHPAARAGILEGDDILAVDGTPITDASAVAPAINRTHLPVRLLLRRGAVTRTISIVPDDDGYTRRIGVELDSVAQWRHASVGEAIVYAARMPVVTMRASLAETFAHFGRPHTAMGPVGYVLKTRKLPRRDQLFALDLMLAYLALLLMLPVSPYDGGRALGRLLRRPLGGPPARDLGVVTPATPSPSLVQRALLVLTLVLLLPLGFSPLLPVAVALLYGVARRRAWAWALLTSLLPAVILSLAWWALVVRDFRRSDELLLATLLLVPLLWLRGRGARALFGLACPNCQRLDGRAVVSAGAMSCLGCGATWRSGH